MTCPRIHLLLAVASAVLAGCNGPAADARPDSAARAEAPTAVGVSRAAATVAAEKFTVHVESPDQVTKGREAVAKVHVSPRASWHMNLDFPAKLSMRTPAGVDVPVPTQQKTDAERFDDDALVFALPFTADRAGSHRFAGEVEFAVCGDAACSPEKVAVEFEVDVGCGTDAVC